MKTEVATSDSISKIVTELRDIADVVDGDPVNYELFDFASLADRLEVLSQSREQGAGRVTDEMVNDAMMAYQAMAGDGPIFGNSSRFMRKALQAALAAPSDAQPQSPNLREAVLAKCDALESSFSKERRKTCGTLAFDALHEAVADLRFYCGAAEILDARPAQAVTDWTDAQCAAFLDIALRNVDLTDERGPSFNDVRLGVKAALTATSQPPTAAQPAAVAAGRPTTKGENAMVHTITCNCCNKPCRVTLDGENWSAECDGGCAHLAIANHIIEGLRYAEQFAAEQVAAARA